MSLTDADRQRLDRARELATLRDADAIRRHAGEDDTALALAAVFGAAQELLVDLSVIIYRLAAGTREDGAIADARRTREHMARWASGSDTHRGEDAQVTEARDG